MTITAKGANGTVTVDDEWVTLDAKVYRGQRRIPLDKVSGVEFKTASTMLNGSLTVLASGVEPFPIAYRKKAQADFDAVRDAIERR